MAFDIGTQILAALVRHDQVDGVVGTKEVGDVNDIGMADLRQGRRLIEKALDALAESIRRLAGNAFDAGIFQSPRLIQGEVLFDGDLQAVFHVCRQIHNAEAAATECSLDAVSVQQESIRERSR